MHGEPAAVAPRPLFTAGVTRASSRRRRALGIAATVVACAALLSALYHPPLALIVPGPTIDITRDVTIAGASPPTGRFILTTVRFERPTLLRVVAASLLSLRQVTTLDYDIDRVRRELRRFEQSRVDASDAAGAREVHFQERRILGGSAGLLYALVIADMLDPADLARGRTIAAMGSIRNDGTIGDVAGMPGKLASLVRYAPEVVLVGSNGTFDAWRVFRHARGVDTLEQAVAALKR